MLIFISVYSSIVIGYLLSYSLSNLYVCCFPFKFNFLQFDFVLLFCSWCFELESPASFLDYVLLIWYLTLFSTRKLKLEPVPTVSFFSASRVDEVFERTHGPCLALTTVFYFFYSDTWMEGLPSCFLSIEWLVFFSSRKVSAVGMSNSNFISLCD